jgi:hypothetical protein
VEDGDRFPLRFGVLLVVQAAEYAGLRLSIEVLDEMLPDAVRGKLRLPVPFQKDPPGVGEPTGFHQDYCGDLQRNEPKRHLE